MTEQNAVPSEIVDGSRQLAAEIRTQRELALSRPRNELAIFEAAIKELEIAPEFAEDAYYSIPYSVERGSEEKTLIEGLSVKSSRAVGRRWGNCATASRIISEDGDAVTVEGIFADFESNAFFRRTIRVPKTYIPSKTKIPVPLRSDRLNLAIQAGMSKAERNAALSALPEWFKERYFAKAKAIAGSKGKKEKTVSERVALMVADFSKLRVDKERVEAYITAKFGTVTDANADEVLGTMRGIFNAIKDGQIKADEAFPGPEKPTAGSGPVSGGMLSGAGEKV